MKRVLIVSLIALFTWACSDDTEPANGQKDSSVTADKGSTKADKGTTKADKGTTKADKGTTKADKGTTTPDKGTTTPDKGTTDSTASAGFGASIWPIFKTSCASGYCHGGGSGGLSMKSETDAYSNLVGVKAKGCSSLNRVEAGDILKSYLMQKLKGKGNCFTGQKMPAGGTLTQANTTKIESWINGGAKK